MLAHQAKAQSKSRALRELGEVALYAGDQVTRAAPNARSSGFEPLRISCAVSPKPQI